MRATKKTLLGLTGALAACIAAVLLLTFTGNGREAEDHAHTYYFTTYDSPEDLVLASVENSTGSVVLAASGGTYYTVGDLKLSADGAQVQSFFETVYKLPMKRLLDEADASDPQYGLTNHQAEILIQDTAEGGVLFRVGSATPDGEGYYACLSGDTRVFIMDQAYGAIFLNNVNRFYDLSLYPSLMGDDLGGLRGLSVERGGKQVYALTFSATQDGSVTVFSMTEPYALPLGAAQTKNEILTPLRDLRGVDALNKPEDLTLYGLTDGAGKFVLTYEDGTMAVIRVGRQEGAGTYVLREGSDVVMLVPTANLSFFYNTALQVMGQNLVSVSLGDLASLRIGDHTYQISGTPPALKITLDGSEEPLDAFQNGVYTALNRISVQGAWDGGEKTEPLLKMQIEIKYADGTTRTTDYAFYELEDRRCGVAVNGQPVFICSRSAVQALVEAT